MGNVAFREVIVVEGKHDIQKLKSVYPDIDCVETGGSDVSETTLVMLEKLAKTRGLILLMDADYPGRQITNIILSRVKNCKMAFISASRSRSKNQRKVGVEHASKEAIRHSLDHLFTPGEEAKNEISRDDLRQRKLVDSDGAQERRMRLAEMLGLPVSNGKTLLRLLNMFQVDLAVLDEVTS